MVIDRFPTAVRRAARGLAVASALALGPGLLAAGCTNSEGSTIAPKRPLPDASVDAADAAGAAGAGGAAGGSAGAGGTAGAAGGHAGTGGNAGAGGTAGAAGGAGGQVATDAGVDGLAACGTDNDTSEGLTCTTLDATGGCVTATISHDPPPTAAGGNIQQGTYDLVSITAYPGDAGSAADVLSPVRKTVVLTNGTANVLNLAEADLSGSFLRRQTGTLSTSGTTLTFTQACPAADAGSGSGTASYTFAPGATPTLTVIENHDTHGMVVEVYQKRP
ncbi:MAG TPA: hypothetical protein VHH90_07265 [Polyangia bacterium]|nr:hypothetical protein [Polyangia bacterium]